MVEKSRVAPGQNPSRSVSSPAAAGRDALHPCPGEWMWWASYDGGEVFSIGPEFDRAGLIQAVKDDCCGEYQTDTGGWRIAARIAGCPANNCDLSAVLGFSRVTGARSRRRGGSGSGS